MCACGVGSGGRLDATGCACGAGPAAAGAAERLANMRCELGGQGPLRLIWCAHRAFRNGAHLRTFHTGQKYAGTTPSYNALSA
jgi:hypothetical protein